MRSCCWASAGAALTLQLIPGHPGFLLAILPPGAFIGLGLLVAARNWQQARGQAPHSARRLPATERTARMNKADRIEFFRRLRAHNPHPTTELEYDSPFELLIAVILSAQATDVGVNKATRAAVSGGQHAGGDFGAG